MKVYSFLFSNNIFENEDEDEDEESSDTENENSNNTLENPGNNMGLSTFSNNGSSNSLILQKNTVGFNNGIGGNVMSDFTQGLQLSSTFQSSADGQIALNDLASEIQDANNHYNEERASRLESFKQKEDLESYLKMFSALFQDVSGIRRAGSAARRRA